MTAEEGRAREERPWKVSVPLHHSHRAQHVVHEHPHVYCPSWSPESEKIDAQVTRDGSLVE